MNRRKMLTVLGATGINMLTGYSHADSGAKVGQRMFSCVVTPQQTEGPYFVDERLQRSDIRSDPSDGSIKEGVPLALEFRVYTVSGTVCKPLPGAYVDVWHCDAHGVYSDVMDSGFNTLGKKFLRGYQITDANGSVRFITIYPGWYPGRTVHIHFKIRTDPRYMRGIEFTSQIYFNDSITDQVYTQPPYASRGPRAPKNEGDSIFRKGGNRLMISLVKTDQGYDGTFDVGLELG
ncbi:Dioxygenase [Nitrosospira sp. Nl5]|uniref:intradiol ring-cleavage dioxygenase n=1 Tax=Nitrosospira sp. Nl5 TaxID=200120 RepID=UPI00087FA2AC|nr:intradiol ring-cleavage dioxygenase [Nitrosospira sp. Nl5]SCY64273.1 Dioxygenase [Nitrosospira sp. Nl5]